MTPALAQEFQGDIVRVHNTIPFQRWTANELSAEELEGRKFHGKWELSHVAFIGGLVAAINIAYERPAEAAPYVEDSVYMHRFAVEPRFRQRWLGRLFHAHAMDVAFRHVATAIRCPVSVLYGQTQATLENAHVLRFYTEGCGFAAAGFKYYPDKVDVVLRVGRDDFYRSAHWQALQGRREALGK